MRKKIRKTALLLVTFFIPLPNVLFAQEESDEATKHKRTGIKDHTVGILRAAAAGVEFRLKAGIAVGGVSPLPIPLNIQEVQGYSPGINLSIEAEFVQDFNGSVGYSTGLRVETKGMTTNARVAGYSMSMSDGGQEVSGVWWGMVETQVSNNYLTVPVLLLWKPSPRWDVKIGPYGSFVIGRQFTGSVYDGYLREGSPVGEKVVFEGGRRAYYDFSKNLSRWDWGAQLAADWRAFPHLLVGMDLTWGLKDVFEKDFRTVAFNMYPIFLRLNFGYAF